MEFNANFSFYLWRLFVENSSLFFSLRYVGKSFLKKQMLHVRKKKLKVLRESARNRLVPAESASACLTPASYTAPFHLQEVC